MGGDQGLIRAAFYGFPLPAFKAATQEPLPTAALLGEADSRAAF